MNLNPPIRFSLCGSRHLLAVQTHLIATVIATESCGNEDALVSACKGVQVNTERAGVPEGRKRKYMHSPHLRAQPRAATELGDRSSLCTVAHGFSRIIRLFGTECQTPSDMGVSINALAH